jgi:hypothetical protein
MKNVPDVLLLAVLQASLVSSRAHLLQTCTGAKLIDKQVSDSGKYFYLPVHKTHLC